MNRRKIHILTCAAVITVLLAVSTQETLVPPVAAVHPRADTIHGDIRIDNYFWLRERENPDVRAYIEEENNYTMEMMKHTEGLQETLYQEMLSKIKETDLSVPEKLDDYYYYTRTEEGKQYPVYCRKKGNLDEQEEILLDQNALAQGYAYFDIGVISISPQHDLLAYSIDTAGSEVYTLCIKDIAGDSLYREHISNTGYTAAWAQDNATLFYTVLDNARRPYKLYRHHIGRDPAADTVVYTEDDDAFWLYIHKTKSKEFLIIDLGSHTTSEVRYLRADNPTGTFTVIHPRQQDMEYSVEHHDDRFFILTNDNAKNFRLMEAPISNPAKANWHEIIAHRDSVKLEGFDVFQSHLVVYERVYGLPHIRVTDFRSGETHDIEFTEPVYTVWGEANREFNTTLLRFSYTSFVTPRAVYDYDMVTRKRELKKQYEVRGGYDPHQYASERLFAVASDGTMIPISLVYKNGMKRDGTHPLYLMGYGAYGSIMDPYFSSNRLSLLDRGFIYAVAHVRGGGEMGRYWYDQGRLFNKKNTFTDFIACAEYLILEKYTSSEKLVINGGSAGGLLIGAVTNMKPDLAHVVIADMPFVDLINTMLDPSLPLTVLEYEEWGNPHEQKYYDYMKSYSPYDNVTAQNYPHMLITAGLNDMRVQYWEGAKWTARLRALKTDNNVLLLKTNMGTGHLGASGRYDYLREIAFEYAFVFDMLGIKN